MECKYAVQRSREQRATRCRASSSPRTGGWGSCGPHGIACPSCMCHMAFMATYTAVRGPIPAHSCAHDLDNMHLSWRMLRMMLSSS